MVPQRWASSSVRGGNRRSRRLALDRPGQLSRAGAQRRLERHGPGGIDRLQPQAVLVEHGERALPRGNGGRCEEKSGPWPISS